MLADATQNAPEEQEREREKERDANNKRRKCKCCKCMGMLVDLPLTTATLLSLVFIVISCIYIITAATTSLARSLDRPIGRGRASIFIGFLQ